MIHIPSIFIVLMGMSHFLRDAYAYQHQANTELFQLAESIPWLSKWWHGTSTNQSWKPDWYHFWDSMMRWSSAFYGASVIMTVPPDVWWLPKVLLFVFGLYLSEWFFTIMYHSVNPSPGHRDYIPLHQTILWLIMPWRKPGKEAIS